MSGLTGGSLCKSGRLDGVVHLFGRKLHGFVVSGRASGGKASHGGLQSVGTGVALVHVIDAVAAAARQRGVTAAQQGRLNVAYQRSIVDAVQHGLNAGPRGLTIVAVV